MSLKETARETLRICEEGRYVAPSGREVSLGDAVPRAIAGTRLRTPDQLERAMEERAWRTDRARTRVEVTGETTQLALQRLAPARPVALSFASARRPGGGFVTGAKAQEEDLARCSALYPCLLEQRAYYEANRALDSVLYTDHVIHSRDVPFFRVRSRELIEEPFLASIITAPAPNAGQALARDPGAGPAIDATLRRRASFVLAIAALEEHATVVLGAWGCGVFRNDPARVADAFAGALEITFRGTFERVVFAILDRSAARSTIAPFEARFADHPR